jgi:hypothetical protein
MADDPFKGELAPRGRQTAIRDYFTASVES